MCRGVKPALRTDSTDLGAQRDNATRAYAQIARVPESWARLGTTDKLQTKPASQWRRSAREGLPFFAADV